MAMNGEWNVPGGITVGLVADAKAEAKKPEPEEKPKPKTNAKK